MMNFKDVKITLSNSNNKISGDLSPVLPRGIDKFLNVNTSNENPNDPVRLTALAENFRGFGAFREAGAIVSMINNNVTTQDTDFSRRLTIAVGDAPEDQKQHVHSITEAEYIYFNTLEEVTNTEGLSLYLRINSQANLIASRTRRGAGNRLFVNSNIVESLKTGFGFNIYRKAIQKIGNWSNVGIVNNCIKIWADDHCPLDKMFLIYAQSCEKHIINDGPGALDYDENNELIYVRRINGQDYGAAICI